MSLESVKSGFISYLTEKLGEDAGNNIAELERLNSTASIFMYSEEFKEYLVEEYNADASIFSKSMNEIMQMDFDNGEITDPAEHKQPISQEDMANFIDGVDNPENYEFDMGFSDGLLAAPAGETASTNNNAAPIADFSDGRANSAQASIVPGETTDGQTVPADIGQNAVPESEFVVDPNAQATVTGTEASADGSNITPDSTIDISGSEIPSDGTETIPDETISSSVVEDNTVSEDNTEFEVFDDEAIDEFESSEIEEPKYNEEITKMLDEAYLDDKVIKALDTDMDGKLSDEEKEAFEAYVKGDNEELKQEDLEKALKAIEEGKFSYDIPLNEIELEELEEPEETEPETEEVTETSSPSNVSGASGGGYGGGSSGGINAAQASKVEKGITLEELETKRKEKEGEVSEAQSEISDIYSGKNEAVSNAKEDYEDAKKAYDDAVEKDDKIDKQTKDDRKENISNIEEKEKEIDTINGNIAETEASISEQQSVVDAGESNLQALKDSLSALDSVKSTNADKQAEIDAKRTELEGKIAEADEQLTIEKEKLQKLEDKKKDYEDKLKQAESDLDKLETEKADIEKIISENASQETKDAMKEFNDARDNVSEVKEKELATAKSNLSIKQNELDEINKQINEKKAEQTKKENAVTSGMQAAVDWARKYDDMSQAQMQQVFAQLGYRFDQGAWCADFVRMALGEGVGDENLPDWYKAVDNKAYCPSIASAGNGHQVSAEEAETGDIVLYDWNSDGTPDHVGLFVDNGDGSTTITAIEGNTSGSGGRSCVEEKARSRGNIYGIYSMRV